MKPTRIIIPAFFSFLLWNTCAYTQDNPVADFSINPNPACMLSPVTFTDLSYDPNGHNIISWQWSFGDGSTSTLQNPTHWYTAIGNIEIQLIVYNDVGGSDTVSHTITTFGMNVSLSTTNIICFGSNTGSISAFVNGTNPPFQYLWSNSMNTSTIANLSPGNYSVTVNDSYGCTSVMSATITEPPLLTISFTTSPCVDINGVGWINSVITGGTPPYTYMWSNGSTYHSITGIISGTYSLTVADAHICTSSADTNLNSIPVCSYTLQGRIYQDSNGNCLADSGEQAVPHVLLYTNPGPYFSYTNDSGYYSMPLDTGTYSVIPILPNNWNVSCPSLGYQLVVLSNYSDTITGIDFGIEPVINCPNLHVHAGSGNIRPCFQTSVYMMYSNHGAVPAMNSYIELELDSDIVPYNSSIPWTSFTGNIYRFDLGQVEAFESGWIYVYANVECDLGLLGHTKCITAHIYPDSACVPLNPAWDHSSISLEGECRGDSLICFTITNNGSPASGNMQGTSEYRVFSNDTLVFSGTFQLDGGESTDICWPAAGAAIRLEADQRPNHPGNSHPAETIEDCGDTGGTSLGYITTNTPDDQDEFIDIYCRLVTNSCDPNEKQVQPSGVTDNHYISNNSPLHFHIDFQNTGTDTAFNVIIRDTLSPYLDVTTIQPGATSHPCSFRVYGQGILEWTFSNILLPDSNINEPASHGFVSFDISLTPLTENDYGTVITNKADIYFDFNPPVITNEVELVFWDLPIVLTHRNEYNMPGTEINVYPNPASTRVTFELNGLKQKSPLYIRIYDISGRIIVDTEFPENNIISLPVEYFKKGLYVYMISGDGSCISRGKVSIE